MIVLLMEKVISMVFLPSGSKLPYNYGASPPFVEELWFVLPAKQGRPACPVHPAGMCARGSDHRLCLHWPPQALLPGQPQDGGLLAAAPAFPGGPGRQAFLLLLGLFWHLWVDHQERGCEEAQERAHGSHGRDDMHSPDSINHAPQGGRHQDLGDVDLAGEDGAIYAKATLGVPGAVVDVLQEKRACGEDRGQSGHQAVFPWFAYQLRSPETELAFHSAAWRPLSLSPRPRPTSIQHCIGGSGHCNKARKINKTY